MVTVRATIRGIEMVATLVRGQYGAEDGYMASVVNGRQSLGFARSADMAFAMCAEYVEEKRAEGWPGY